MNLWLKGGLAAGVLMMAVGGAWFFSGSEADKAASAWYQGNEGYQSAQRQALSSGQPLLYVLETPKCRRCKVLDQRFWQSDEMVGPLSRLVKVRLNSGSGDGSEQILRRFPRVATPPGIYVQRPGEPLRPIKLVVDINQIWMPGKTWQRGFYMPLSAAAFETVLETTLTLQDPALDNAPLE